MSTGERGQSSIELTRARMLGGVAGGALAATLAACGGAPQPAPTTTAATSEGDTFGRQVEAFDPAVEEAFGPGDAGIANYALTLEYLEADFYDRVIASKLFSGDQLALLREIGDNEHQHVRAIKALLEKVGGKAVDPPKTQFELGNQAEEVLGLAEDIENLGAAAYLGQATRIENLDVLKLALSIHTTEGAHAAALATLLDRTITPDGSIAAPANGTEVLKKVKPFLVSKA